MRQLAQRRRHDRGIAHPVVREHARKPQGLRLLGADELLAPGHRARHEQGSLVQRQDFAKGIVTAHRHHAGGGRHQRLHLGVEGNRLKTVVPGDPLEELGLAVGLHERTQDDERRVRQMRVGLVGAQHPIDQYLAVAAAARGYQEERLVGYRHRRGGVLRHAARQVTGEHHLFAHRGGHRNALERIADLRQAVDPDLVVQVAQRRHRVLAPPLAGQLLGVVEHVAQPQHQGRAACLQALERLAHLAAQSQRLLVDDEDVRVEYFRRVLDDRGPHGQGLLDVDVQAERRVLAIAQLDDAGYADKIDPRPVVEVADDRRAGKDQYRHARMTLDQGMGDRPAPAQMAESERVVAVDQDPGVAAARYHDQSPAVARSSANYGTARRSMKW